jgi:exosortase/archaeosortase family protein
MKKTSPIKIQICAVSTRFNRYKAAPIHKSKMPSSKTRNAKSGRPRQTIPYVAAVSLIILAVYYLPSYFFLEKATADHTAFVLNALGLSVQTKVISNNVYLADIKIVKDCTGVQAIAAFVGMLLPLPNAPLKKKLHTLVIISTLIYGANVLRIALEFSLVYFDILPWVLAHYPLSLFLGIMGVIILVFVTDHLLPEFGDFFATVTRPRVA